MNDLVKSDLSELAMQINAEGEAAATALTKGFEHAMRAGDLLLRAREAVPHRQWLPWLGANCDIPARTAQLAGLPHRRRVRAAQDARRVSRDSGPWRQIDSAQECR